MHEQQGFRSARPGSREPSRLRQLPTALKAAGAFAALFAGSAGAVGLQGDNWTVDVGGIVNAYYTATSCSGDPVGGTALAGKALGCAGENHKTTIGNGLLPSGLITKFKTQQEGFEIGGTVGIMVHAATSSGVATNTNVDVRQAFFTIGTPEMGTFKLGRDYGVFGANAILNDMTLLGAGAPTQATQRGRVTLGHIGAGYTYLQNYGQMTYASPTFGGGFTFTAGLMSPVDAGVFASKNYPQVQAQLQYANDTVKFWVGAKTQRFYSTAFVPAFDPNDPNASYVITPDDHFDEFAAEVGASFTAGGFNFLANVQGGSGIGILADGDQGDVDGLNYLLQGTYKFTDKMKFGVSYGLSKNDDDKLYNDLLNGSFKSNENMTVGLYYALTSSITLAAEVSETRSKDYIDQEAKQFGGSFGGIIFF
ncbi:MAG TPA: porin [Rhodanobacteraceae bacterium]|nr:porin [Rhodanobacteraceae bacterium]